MTDAIKNRSRFSIARSLRRIWPPRVLPRQRRRHQAQLDRQRTLTEQFEREGHHPECDVWATRRWCTCKGMPYDVIEPSFAYICRRGGIGEAGCHHERLK